MKRVATVFSAGLLLAVAGTAQEAAAQQPSFAGQWACQMTYTEFNRQGQRTSGFTREFMMAIYPNGQFEAAGTMASVAGYNQFRSLGQWQVEQGSIVAQGPEQQDSSYPVPGLMFVFIGTLQPDGSMAHSFEQPDPNRQYVMNRTLQYCERRG